MKNNEKLLTEQQAQRLVPDVETVPCRVPDLIRYVRMTADADATGQVVSDSSTRLGHFVIASPAVAELMPYLPAELVAALDVCDVQAAVDAAGGA